MVMLSGFVPVLWYTSSLLLTEGLGQSDSVETEVEVQTEKETRPSDDTDLFFVDNSKDEDTAAQMGTGDPDQDHSEKEIQILGEIHTLLGGINVGEDMPEEREEGSEDSDVEEVEFKVPKSKAKRKEEVAEIVAQSLKTYRRQSVRRRAQEERDSTSGPWAVKSPVSPLHVRAVQKDSRDSIDSTQEQAVDLESSKLEECEEKMSAAMGEDISDVPQQMEVIKISSADEVEDEEELVKNGRDIPKSVDKGQKKKGRKEKGKKKSKKESKEHEKLERSFGDIKCLEGESYDSTQESVEMMAFKATASELLQDVEKFMHTTKEEIHVDTDKEESKMDTSEAMKEVETAGNVENGEDDSFQPEITVSDEENEVEKDNESVEVECDADSGELSDAEKEESQDTSINQMEESPTVEEQGLADVQDVSDSEESDSDDEGLTSTILKLRQNLVAPTSMAEPALDQSEVIPLEVEGYGSTTAGKVVSQSMEEEEVVEEGPSANVAESGETEKKTIFKTPVSPARGKSSPARANFSPSKASPVKTAGGAASTTARKRRLSTDDELRELAAEVTEKIAQENSEDDVKSLAPSTPPQKSSDKRRRSMLGQSYGKYIEKQTFPDVIIDETDTGDVVSDQTEKVDAPADLTSAEKDQDSPSEHENLEDPDTLKGDKSETVCPDEIELEESSKMLMSSKTSAKEAKAREPTPMVKRERRKTAQQTLQPVGEVPSHDSDSSVSSSSRRKSLRRRKLDLKDAEQEAEQSKTKKQSVKVSDEITAQAEESVQILEDKESEETTMEVTPTEETADVDKQKGEEEDDVTLAQPISDSASSEQPAESTTGKKKQGKVLRMVKTPTPKKHKEEEQRIKLVSPQGSPEVQFATSGHIVVRVSSDSPDHKPVILHSPTGELIIKAHNPRVVVAPDLTGDPKRLDFNTGTGDKHGGQPAAEETGTKGEVSLASMDVPKGKMGLRTRSRSPIPSDSGSMTSVSSMSEAGSKSRRKSRRSSRKVEPVLQEEGDEKDDKDLTLDISVPSTSGTRPRRSKAPKDILSQQTQLASDSDLSVSSQSSSKRRRSKAAGVASDQDVSDNQGIRRSSRKRAKDKTGSPPKKLKTTEEEEDVEMRQIQKETDSGPELIVLDSSPVQGTQEDQTEAVGTTRPVTRSRVKRESESTTVSEVWSDVDMFSLSPPHTKRSRRLKAVHETLSNASSVSDQSALDSETGGEHQRSDSQLTQEEVRACWENHQVCCDG
ncbi:PREDICTED: biorientation of chromosomes in cell division protein 1-like 1 [Branchiostoma belcheri]|uniref:Biorientation of chromosomes in cell division protein 1-like 1 n=1 Tax=Branchiostoma belcheri TaxID=7741 RepID=A0A6P4ZZX4_BRABE|nr:PREDICTED: biorientation of chromosomes in cell division protein 1-like 1 [Branchiostoma belcheri]